MMENKILFGNTLDVLDELPEESVDCVITSPPYYQLRDYGDEVNFIWDEDKNCNHEWNKKNFCVKCGAWKGQLGLEPTPELYVKHLADIFDKVKKVLKSNGNVFINIGDTYKNKQLLMTPYMLAFELQKRGWFIRDLIIWSKKVYDLNEDIQFGNALPENISDRLTRSYEIVIHATKSENYYFNKPKTKHVKVGNVKKIVKNNKLIYESNEIYEFDDEEFEIKINSKYLDTKEINIGASITGKNMLKILQDNVDIKEVVRVNLYLKKKLKESGLSISDLQKLTGIEPTTLSKFFSTALTSRAIPDKDTWNLLKQFLDLDEYDNVITDFDRTYSRVFGTYAFICNVIKCNTESSTVKHFAIMPTKLVEFLINIGCVNNGIVLDPFGGSGTVGMVSKKLGRKYILIDANSEYVEIMKERLENNTKQKSLF